MLSRLPWSKELPRAWRAAMRPTPVMMPVNIRVFSQGLEVLSGRLSSADREIGAGPPPHGLAARWKCAFRRR
jgi:hypothetical protein